MAAATGTPDREGGLCITRGGAPVPGAVSRQPFQISLTLHAIHRGCQVNRVRRVCGDSARPL